MLDIYERLKDRLEDKDRMHGRDHVERVITRAMGFEESMYCDIAVLTLAIIVHGMEDAEQIMKEEGVEPDLVSRVTKLNPSSIEKKILRDAHILEGNSDFFQIYKSLITSFERGESLDNCVKYATSMKWQTAALIRNEEEIEKRREIFDNFFAELSELLE